MVLIAVARRLSTGMATGLDLGPRFWYGGPWAGTTLVSARKPA
jgi:hypothetical protein